MFSGKIKIAPVDGKGLGIIAMEDIKQGELLLADEPLIVFNEWSPATVLTSWKSLSKEKKEVYLSLSNCHPEMNTVVGIAVTNMIPVTRDISQLAVFPNMARINHSCVPNCNNYQVTENILCNI